MKRGAEANFTQMGILCNFVFKHTSAPFRIGVIN